NPDGEDLARPQHLTPYLYSGYGLTLHAWVKCAHISAITTRRITMKTRIPGPRTLGSARPSLRTRALVTAAAATVLASPVALAGPALAGGAESHFSYSTDFGPQESDTSCPFPVMITGHIDARGNSFDGQDSNGNLTITHWTEQDAFTGPTGKTLVGLPYTGTVHNTDAGVNAVSGFVEV